MVKVQTGVDLLPYNTLRVSVKTKYFVELNSPDDLNGLPKEKTLILGHGANILFTKNFEGLIIKNNLRGKQVNGDIVDVAGGEDWHQFVMWTVENGWSGVENLALCPGTVGAAPVQNLAAYGQNVGEAIVSVSGINLASGHQETLGYEQCHLYYRDSIFKHELKDKFFITSVKFKLSKTAAKFDTNYHSRWESLAGELEKLGKKPPYTPKDIAEGVIAIRTLKLPDWRKVPTAGSFFKNPFVSTKKYAELAKEISELQMYPVNKMLYPNPKDPVFKLVDQVKIPAARLLDELGWRGKKIGRVGTHEKHALIVINLGGATGVEILNFTHQMQADVKRAYDVDLEPEVNII